MPTNDEIVQLGIEYNPGDVADFNTATDQVVSKLHGISTASDQINSSVQQLRDTLVDTMNTSKDSIQGVDQVVQQLRDSLDQTSDSVKNVSVNLSEVTGLKRTGSALSQLGLGSVGGSVTRVGDIVQVVKEFDDLSGVLSKVGDENSILTKTFTDMAGEGATVATSLGAVGLALGAVTIAFQAFENVIKDGEKQLQAALDTQQQYYTDLTKMSTEDAKNKVLQLQIQADSQQQAVDETNKAIQRGLDQIKQNTGIEIAPGSIAAKAAFKDLYDQLDKDNKALNDTNDAIGRLTGGLQSNAFAANDVTQALDKQLAKQQEYNKLAESSSSKQVSDRIREDADNIKSYQQAIDSLQTSLDTGSISQDQYNAKVADYATQIQQLQDDQNALTQSVLPLIKAREDEAKAVKEMTAAIQKGETGIVNFFKAIGEDSNKQLQFAQETDTLNSNFQQKQADEKAIFQKQELEKDAQHAQTRADNLQKLYNTLEKDDQKASEQELQQTIDLSRKEAQLSQDLADKIIEDRERARDSEVDAAYSLDAVKVQQLQRSEKQQEKADTDSINKQKKQAEIDTANRIADMKKAAEEAHNQRLQEGLQQIQDEDNRYQQQRQQSENNFQDKLDQEKNQFDIQMAARDAKFKEQESHLTQHETNMSDIQTAGQALIEQSFKGFFTNLASGVPSTTATSTAISNPGTANPYISSSSGDYQYSPNGYTGMNQTYANIIGSSPFNLSTADYSASTISEVQNEALNSFAGYVGSVPQTVGTSEPTINSLGNSSITASQFQTAISQPDNSNNPISSGIAGGLSAAIPGYGLLKMLGIGGFASGGVATGKAVVGENGPELIDFKQPTQVYSHDDSMAMMGSTMIDKIADNINITVPEGTSQDESYEIVKNGIMRFYREVATKKSGNNMRRLT